MDAYAELSRATRVNRLAEIARHVLFEAHRAGRFAEINATHSDVELISLYMFTSARIELKATLDATPEGPGLLDEIKKLSDSADCT